MKNSIRIVGISLTFLLLISGSATSSPDEGDPTGGGSSQSEVEIPQEGVGDGEQDDLDVLEIAIENSAVRSMLGADRIALRNPDTFYRPIGEALVPIFEEVSEEDLLNQIDVLQSRFGQGRVESQDEIIIVRSGYEGSSRSQLGEWLDVLSRDAEERPVEVDRSIEGGIEPLRGYRAWVSRASGAWKLTVVDGSMARPTQIENVVQAAQLALARLADLELLDLAEGESLDIVSASSVRNAVVNAGNPDDPQSQFTSDYYVVFGRRVHGIPVLGSRLVVRLGAEGQLASVEKSWRKIVGYGDLSYSLSDQSIEELMIGALSDADEAGTEPGAEPPQVQALSCGYMEAPGNRTQQVLVPGCRILARDGGDEQGDSSYELDISLVDSISEASLYDVGTLTLPFTLKPKITAALPIPFAGLQPGTHLFLKGYGFGTSKGRVLMHGNFPGSPVELVNVEWVSDIRVNGLLPSNLTDICVQDVFIQVERADQVASDLWPMLWHQESAQLNFSDVFVSQCGDDGNENKCNTTEIDGEWCAGLANIPVAQILPSGKAIYGYHRNCYYAVGPYDSDVDQYQIDLLNGWTFESAQVDKTLPTSNEVITGPTPPLPVGQSSWSPKFDWEVSPGDEVIYEVEITVTGPATCSHK
jgi:hypothetical protein